ncbi:hypothetical protein L6R50_06145 [Myxococcota bacterium]|nr:hypothetical protein [Myxococcota bacterium]
MALRAYIVATGSRLSPFGDAVQDVLVLNRPLCGHQDDALRAVGFEPVRVDSWDRVDQFPCLAFPDDLYVTRQLLRDFLKAAAGASARAGIRASQYLANSHPLQDLVPARDGEAEGMAYELWHLASAADLARRGELPVRLVDPREKVTEVPVPAGFRAGADKDRRTLAAGTTRRAMHVRHWIHLLRVNLDAIGGTFQEAFEERKLSLVLRGLWFLLTFPFRNRNRVFSRIGKKCKIHRTAIVEASWIGDGVHIGPYSVVQGAVLGDGVAVAAHSQIALSVMGPGSWLTRGAFVFCSVVYPGAFVGMPFTQVSVIGRGATTTSLAGLVDINFFGDVKVRHQGRLVDSGTNFLGSAVGHGATLGTRLFVSPGREVPNGYFVTGAEEGWVNKLPEGLPTGVPLVVRGATVVDPRPAEPTPSAPEAVPAEEPRT